MKKLLLAAVLLAGTALATPASALTWNFGQFGTGTLPNTETFTIGGLYGLNVTGYSSGNVARALFSKNEGGNEVGLGINGLLDNEISGGSFIQVNMDGLRSLLTNFKFSMNSVDNNEGWVVFGTMDGDRFSQATILAHSSGLGDEGVHTLADGFDNYNFLFATSGFGGSTGGSNVLLHSFSAELQAVPIPPAAALFLSGLVGLFAIRRRKKALNVA